MDLAQAIFFPGSLLGPMKTLHGLSNQEAESSVVCDLQQLVDQF